MDAAEAGGAEVDAAEDVVETNAFCFAAAHQLHPNGVSSLRCIQ